MDEQIAITSQTDLGFSQRGMIFSLKELVIPAYMGAEKNSLTDREIPY